MCAVELAETAGRLRWVQFRPEFSEADPMLDLHLEFREHNDLRERVTIQNLSGDLLSDTGAIRHCLQHICSK